MATEDWTSPAQGRKTPEAENQDRESGVESFSEQWQVTKPVVRSEYGVVAAQNWRAAEVGAEILRAGGNAVDAALATGFALGVVEPWMSGLGGCGYMLVYSAAEGQVHAVDFGTRSPAALDPAAFPLAPGGADDDLFGWPLVEGQRNLHGPLSIGVPGTVAGFGLAHDRFGRLPWAELLAPAIALAHQGHPVDWWTTLKIAGEARELELYPEAAATYLPDGLPPVAAEYGMTTLPLGQLGATLERLAAAGARDFYDGEIARSIAREVAALGGVLSLEDLQSYQARVRSPQALPCADGELHVLSGLNAGPTFAAARALLPALPAGLPGAAHFTAYASALGAATETRLATLGHDGDQAGQGSTTHLSVVDRDGNMVSLTNTLLSLFGSNVLLPESGVLMNNGIMWFDPRPGRPNSIAPNQPPLCNICPLIATRGGKPWFALGASGGRRILPAVFQIAAFLGDQGLDLEAAIHQPRLNLDGSPRVEVDGRLGAEVLASIAAERPAVRCDAALLPNHYANPQAVLVGEGGFEGAVHVRSPVSAAVGA
ncbi:MAG: gamma-glutamyltransferase [Pseudomonadota bacterium]